MSKRAASPVPEEDEAQAKRLAVEEQRRRAREWAENALKSPGVKAKQSIAAAKQEAEQSKQLKRKATSSSTTSPSGREKRPKAVEEDVPEEELETPRTKSTRGSKKSSEAEENTPSQRRSRRSIGIPAASLEALNNPPIALVGGAASRAAAVPPSPLSTPSRRSGRQSAPLEETDEDR